MANETTLTIVGNLTADPELRFTPAGVAACRFTVASTPRTYDRQSGEWRDGDPLFLACTAWRELGENIAESLAKGARVVVTGRLRLSRWETAEGDKRSMMQLDVDDIGASLRFARVQIRKLTRTTAPATNGGNAASNPSNGDSGAAAAGGDLWATTSAPSSFDSEPPF